MNLEQYFNTKTVIRCNTQQEYDRYSNYLEKCEACKRNDFFDCNWFEYHKGDVCINLENWPIIEQCYRHYFEENGYIIENVTIKGIRNPKFVFEETL